MKRDMKKRDRNVQMLELAKSDTKISRRSIAKEFKKFVVENQSVLTEAQREQQVLRMKSFYKRKGWSWPPRQLSNASTVHLINEYYGKEVTKHTPKDKLEEYFGV